MRGVVELDRKDYLERGKMDLSRWFAGFISGFGYPFYVYSVYKILQLGRFMVYVQCAKYAGIEWRGYTFHIVNSNIKLL